MRPTSVRLSEFHGVLNDAPWKRDDYPYNRPSTGLEERLDTRAQLSIEGLWLT
jgi:hypothetical protein